MCVCVLCMCACRCVCASSPSCLCVCPRVGVCVCVCSCLGVVVVRLRASGTSVSICASVCASCLSPCLSLSRSLSHHHHHHHHDTAAYARARRRRHPRAGGGRGGGRVVSAMMAQLGLSFAYTAVLYPMAGMRGTHGGLAVAVAAPHFLVFWFVMLTLALAGNAFSTLVAAAAPSQQAALNLYSTAFQTFMFFSGYSIPVHEVWHLYLCSVLFSLFCPLLSCSRSCSSSLSCSVVFVSRATRFTA